MGWLLHCLASAALLVSWHEREGRGTDGVVVGVSGWAQGGWWAGELGTREGGGGGGVVEKTNGGRER